MVIRVAILFRKDDGFMRKHLRQVLATALSALILCTLLFATGTAAQDATFAGQTSTDVPMQESAYNAYMGLLDFFSTTPAENTGSDTPQYPDYYGGSYINENDQLVICVSDNSTLPTQLFNSLPDNYIIEYVTYSYNELKALMAELNEYVLTQNTDVASNINHFALYDDQNRIVVSLFDASPEKIEEFKNTVSDSTALIFEEDSSVINNTASVDPGGRLYNSSRERYASMGYRAKLNGKVGFVTSAHFAYLGNKICIGDTTIAEAYKRNYSGSADVTFCEITNSSYTPSNTISGTSNTLSTTISEPGVGTSINMVGSKSGHLNGYITSTDASARDNNKVFFTNLTEADFLSNSGDSGGIVYSYISSTNTRLTIGIINGSNDYHTYISKANEINAALGTTRY